jgi:hypothetical protein
MESIPKVVRFLGWGRFERLLTVERRCSVNSDYRDTGEEVFRARPPSDLIVSKG